MSIAVTLNGVVLSFPHLFEKHMAPGSTNAKYSAEFIIAERSTAQQVQDAFKRAAIEGGQGDKLQYLESPLKSGDAINKERQKKGKDPRPEIAGKWVLRASDGNYAPVVVGPDPREIIGPDRSAQIFGGCIVNAGVDFYWFPHKVNPGVYCGLRGVQLVSNVGVTPLGGGRPDVSEMFGKVEGNIDTGPSGGPDLGGLDDLGGPDLDDNIPF